MDAFDLKFLEIRNFTKMHISKIFKLIYLKLDSFSYMDLYQIDHQSTFVFPQKELKVLCSKDRNIQKNLNKNDYIIFNVLSKKDAKVIENQSSSVTSDHKQTQSYKIGFSSNKNDLVFDTQSISLFNRDNNNIVDVMKSIHEKLFEDDHMLFNMLGDLMYSAHKIDGDNSFEVKRLDMGNILLFVYSNFSNIAPAYHQ